MPKLSAAELRETLKTLTGWAAAGEAISRQYTCPTFKDAMAFAVRIGTYAEAVDHHPDLLIQYRNVTVTWSTHSENGVTEKDLDAAMATDALFLTHGTQVVIQRS